MLSHLYLGFSENEYTHFSKRMYGKSPTNEPSYLKLNFVMECLVPFLLTLLDTVGGDLVLASLCAFPSLCGFRFESELCSIAPYWPH